MRTIRLIFTVFAIILIITGIGCKPKGNNGDNPFGEQNLPTDIPGLIALLKEPLQASSNEIMAALAAKGVEAVPALIEALAEQNESIRVRVAHTLAVIGVPAVPGLITALDSDDILVRTGAEDALEEIGPDATESVEKLQEVFSSTTTSEQKNIMHALVKITTDPSVIGMIRAALMVDDLRFDALAVLGEYGHAAAPTVPAILPYLEVQGTSARIATIRALTMIGPEPGVVDGIAKRLTDEDLQVRDEAAKALGQLGAPAASATDALIAALNVETEDIRRTMIHTLGELAPDSRGSIDTLTGYLDFEDPQVRRDAAWALGQFGAEASRAVTALQNIADSDEFDYVRLEASHSIALIQGTIQETESSVQETESVGQ